VDWVNKYLNTPNVFVPPAQFFNKNNRAYPEFSAVGDRILMIRGQRIDLGAGTSASTPLAAALIALLNDARFELGKSSLGFLNPMLYKMYSDDPTTFNDVTSGDNRCSINNCCQYGYGAIKGWDAVTGFGTPNFIRMKKYISNMP
jgi:tripeptidyl-peptidase-1